MSKSVKSRSICFGVLLLSMACGSDKEDALGDAAHSEGGPQGSGDASSALDASRLHDASHSADAEAPGDASDEDAAASMAPPLESTGCGTGAGLAYAAGTTAAEITHAGAARTFRVHVPPGYDGSSARALVLLLHGGGGGALQFERASSRFDPVADREEIIAVYPDGSGALKTWNGGGCCGSAVANQVDDVGFVSALLDHLEASLCIDRRRIFASGMSNGAIMSHRLGCELADRIAAIAPVAGTNMTASCTPSRPLPVLQIHGTADGHVPWDGGEGCGPAGVAFTSVPTTIEDWRRRNACSSVVDADVGGQLDADPNEVHCEVSSECAERAAVELCAIEGGGHNWPGGEPPAEIVACPGNGFQSTTFSASEAIWRFFAAHPMPVP